MSLKRLLGGLFTHAQLLPKRRSFAKRAKVQLGGAAPTTLLTIHPTSELAGILGKCLRHFLPSGLLQAVLNLQYHQSYRLSFTYRPIFGGRVESERTCKRESLTVVLPHELQ